MIKIIKPGQVTFNGYCDRCGCEFTYELIDINLTGSLECPTCRKTIYHPSRTARTLQREVSPTPGYLYELTGPTGISRATSDSCATCQMKNISYIGDSPCTWCPQGRVNCLTKSDSSWQLVGLDLAASATSSNSSNTITTAHNCNCGNDSCTESRSSSNTCLQKED